MQTQKDQDTVHATYMWSSMNFYKPYFIPFLQYGCMALLAKQVQLHGKWCSVYILQSLCFNFKLFVIHSGGIVGAPIHLHPPNTADDVCFSPRFYDTSGKCCLCVVDIVDVASSFSQIAAPAWHRSFIIYFQSRDCGLLIISDWFNFSRICLMAD